MRKLLPVFAAQTFLFMLLVAAPASGQGTVNQFYSGKELYRVCAASEDNFLQGMCAGYIAGANDTEQWWVTAGYSPVICTPRDITIRHAIDLVIRYLKKHPEERHRSGSILVKEAFHEAFPCE